MAFFQLALKARKVEKARLNYEDEKLRSIKISEGVTPHYTLRQKIRHQKKRCKRRLKRCLAKLLSCPEDSWFHRKAVLLRTDGTFENYIFKSVIGFLGGILLTYMFFMFFVIQLNFTLSSATLLCSIFGIILTLGLSFSYRIRCLVFLLLPQFFSKRGRQALMAYAFILALTGPAKNTLHNIGVLSESLACGQEQLKEAVKTVLDLIKQPFHTLGDAISKVIKTIKSVVKKIKHTLVAIKRIVLSILRVIKSVFEWLGSVVNICNKKLGTPFDRCQRVFEGAVLDCKAKLGPIFGVVCNLATIVGAVCYIVKPLDFICSLVSYVADSIVGAVKKKIKRFTRQMKAMFYVKIKFSRSYHFETNHTKSFEDISTGIATEIRSRADRFLAVFDWMSLLTTFFMLFMLLRVMHYRHKWLTNDRFDNRYLTKDLRTIDLVRARQDKETVLPLNRRERYRYIPLTSIRLIKMERLKLAKSAVFLCLTTFKLCIHMMADYSLYWILSTIRYYGRFESKVQQPNSVGVYVSGRGYLAELYRSIVKAFLPSIDESTIDSLPCLPDPIPPDLDRYTQIVSLIIFCWIMTIFEPYGLRLRTIVMSYYHPTRAKQRAVWLYNHIIRSRGSFLKYARRQLRRKFGVTEGGKIEYISLRDRFEAVCPLMRKIFRRKEKVCLLCGTPDRGTESYVKCPTPDCPGYFCIQCFADLQNICTICQSPMEYGDLSDMSEEKDSSEDLLPEEPFRKPTKVKKMKEKKKEMTKVDKEDVKFQKKEIIRKDEAEQTDKDVQDSEKFSSDSTYSYTYQDEPPTHSQIVQTRIPFKDIEAQKIKDDVTIQIFNEPLEEDISSYSEEPTSCFVVRAHRRIRSKLKGKFRPTVPPDTSVSTSIADTESISSEEVDEEEVIHIEVDGGSKTNLVEDRETQTRRRSRVMKIIAALSRISWLGRGKGKKDSRSLRRRRPSLMDRIVCMLRRRRLSPTQTYRRIRRKGVSSSSSSFSSCADEEDEDRALIPRDQIRGLRIAEDERIVTCPCASDDEHNIYSKSYESHAQRRRSSKGAELQSLKEENMDLKYPHEKSYPTKDLTRNYLEPLAGRTSYREVDETEDSRSPKFNHQGDEINALSDARTSSDGRKTDRWNITRHDGEQVYSEESNVEETSTDRNQHTARMSNVEEQKNEISEMEKTEDTSRTESVSRNTKEMVNTSPVDTSMENTSSPNMTEGWSTNSPSTASPIEKKTIERSKKIVRSSKTVEMTDPQSMDREKMSEGNAKEEQVINGKSNGVKNEIIPQKHRNLSEPNAKDEPTEKVQGEEEMVSEAEGNQSETVYEGKTQVDKAVDVKDQRRGTQTKLRMHREEKKSVEKRHGETEASTFWDSRRSPVESPHRRKYSETHRRSNRRKRSSPKQLTDDHLYSKRKRRRYRNEYPDMQERDFRESRDEPTYAKCPRTRRVCFCDNHNEFSENSKKCVCKQKPLPPRYGSECHHKYYKPCERCCQRHCLSRPEQQQGFSLAECRHKALQILGKHRCSAGTDAMRQRKLEEMRMKQYLPMYQQPELIEELKKHDRMKSIQQRETRGSYRKPREFTSKFEDTTDTSLVCHSPDSVYSSSEDEATLPYQETEAFKKVVCEFQQRTFPKRGENIEPLISVSERADRTKEVRQLFPPQKRSERTKDTEMEERWGEDSSSVEYTTDNNEISD